MSKGCAELQINNQTIIILSYDTLLLGPYREPSRHYYNTKLLLMILKGLATPRRFSRHGPAFYV